MKLIFIFILKFILNYTFFELEKEMGEREAGNGRGRERKEQSLLFYLIYNYYFLSNHEKQIFYTYFIFSFKIAT